MANNRVAYGLAKEQGINTDGMSPKEVWEALAKKGITQESVSENKIKETKDLQSKSIGELKEMAKSNALSAESPNKKAVMKKIKGVSGFVGTTYGVYNLADGKLLKIFTDKQNAIDFTDKQNASKSTYKTDFNNNGKSSNQKIVEKTHK